MPAANTSHYVTAAEFLEHSAADGPSELVRGAIHVMTPASGAHGAIAGTIFAALNTFVEAHELGVCFPDNTGFLLPGLGDTVRSPDAAFVRTEALPPNGIGPGWISAAPDLVVEILSPNETAAELDAKVRDYFVSGTRLVWVVDPIARVVDVLAAETPAHRLSETEILDGADVLPAFAFPVVQLFARLAR